MSSSTTLRHGLLIPSSLSLTYQPPQHPPQSPSSSSSSSSNIPPAPSNPQFPPSSPSSSSPHVPQAPNNASSENTNHFLSSSQFILWNCHSLNPNHLSQLAIFSSDHHPSIIALCETKRNPNSPIPKLPGYTWYGCDHAANTGGVGLFVSSRLASSARPLPPSSSSSPTPKPVTAQSVFVEVSIPSLARSILIAVIYCPPHSALHWAATYSCIRAAASLASSSNIPLLLLGDFNARHSDFGDMKSSSDPADSTRGTHLINLCTQLHLHILNSTLCYGSPTFPSSNSILDLAITTDPSLIASFQPQPALRLLSDHLPMIGRFSNHLSPSTPPLLPSNRRQSSNLSQSSPKLSFDKMNVELFTNLLEPACAAWLSSDSNRLLLSSIPSSSTSAQQTVEALCTSLVNCFHTAASASTPSLPNRQSINHWFTSMPGVQAALTKYHRAYRQYHKHRNDNSLYQQYLSARREWRHTHSAAKQQSWSNLCSKISDPSNRKLCWSAWHRTIPSSFAPLSSIRQPNQPLPSSPIDSLNRLTKYFAGTCSSSTDNSDHERIVNDTISSHSARPYDQRHQPPTSSPSSSSSSSSLSSLDHDFTVTELKDAASRQRLRSALGADGFSPYYLKHATPSALAALTSLFNYSWHYGVLPSSWKNANVTPLLKDPSLDRSSPSSYRPISLTSILIRFFERVIYRRLHPLLSHRLASQQAGFRSSYSTTSHLHRLQHVITSAFQKHKYQSIAFLDIAKAFDSTWHNGILYKLMKPPFNVTGRCWYWIQAFLSDRMIRVVHDGLTADWCPITAGVPQGSVLAPFLFLIFINDMVHDTVECDIALYADDIALWGSSPSKTGDQQLRQALPRLVHWSKLWKLKFNINKSASVCFNRRRHSFTLPRPFSLSIPNSRHLTTHHHRNPNRTIDLLPQKEIYKYLGLILDSHLNWHNHSNYIKHKIHNSAGLISRIIPPAPSSTSISQHHSVTASPSPSHSLADSGPSFHSIRQLVHSIVRPQLCYGLGIWYPPTKTLRNQLQSSLLRPLLRSLALPPSTHQLSLLVEAASADLPSLRHTSILSLYHHFKQLPHSHPSHQLWQLQRQQLIDGTPSSKGSFVHSIRSLPNDIKQSLLIADNFKSPMSVARNLTFKTWIASSSLSKPNHRHLPSSTAPITRATGNSLRLVRTDDRIHPSVYLQHDSLTLARIRARLRLNRARLADSMYQRGLCPSPLCPHPSCHDDSIRETRSHALLDCPAWDYVRTHINRLLSLTPSINRSMTIHDILGNVDSIKPSMQRLLLQQTGLLLHAIDRHRSL